MSARLSYFILIDYNPTTTVTVLITGKSIRRRRCRRILIQFCYTSQGVAINAIRSVSYTRYYKFLFDVLATASAQPWRIRCAGNEAVAHAVTMNTASMFHRSDIQRLLLRIMQIALISELANVHIIQRNFS